MLSTKNKTYNIKNVPSYWVFQYYICIDQVLSGQNVKIKSVWNTKDSVPSMCIYVDTKRKEYMFKDFSSGKYGDKITFVMEYLNISFLEALDKILHDYNNYIKKNGAIKLGLKPIEKWKVSYKHIREWNNFDAKYWLQYNINSNCLEHFNVKPLEYYTLERNVKNKLEKINIKHSYIYGYHTNEDLLYKIYQPKKKNNKFLKLQEYIQGYDQLTFKKPNLIICSSLKDAMSLYSFNYKTIDVIAPDSENSIIKPYIIENLKKKYNSLITLLDNDEPGKKAIARYKELYNIPGFSINLSKDFSDSVKDHGPQAVHAEFKSLLQKYLKK
jgi:DNA primase